jgi:single-strand selective monofunctional uracil DNA glycosylase
VDLLDASARLRDALAGFPPGGRAAWCYHPLGYAWAPHEAYLRWFGAGAGRSVLVGMNPGFWGMAQTGVPFADPETACGWMGVEGPVSAPARTHPKLPILGFASRRPDPSGRRLYGAARARYGTAQAFFADWFVDNYCPLLFLDAEGANLTPDKLPRAARAALEPACDEHMRALVATLRPTRLVALGSYVAARLRALDLDVPVQAALHPSPANPRNNRGWGEDLFAGSPP